MFTRTLAALAAAVLTAVAAGNGGLDFAGVSH